MGRECLRTWEMEGKRGRQGFFLLNALPEVHGCACVLSYKTRSDSQTANISKEGAWRCFQGGGQSYFMRVQDPKSQSHSCCTSPLQILEASVADLVTQRS